MLQLNTPPLQEISDDLIAEKGVRLFVKRDDMIHPYISGNKWYKLKYNLDAFLQSGKEYLLTLGGAYSNHIVATAAACKECGVKTIGLIRGDELCGRSNSMLQFASECGMQLIFVSRQDYKNIHYLAGLKTFAKTLPLPFEQLYLLQEGGFNELAVKGCEEITDGITVPFDYICCDCGTGATASGIVRKLQPWQQAILIAVLRGESFLEKQIDAFAGKHFNKMLTFDYHFGGFAKTNKELLRFCSDFIRQHHILIEPIYTGKLFYGIYDLLKKDFFRPGSTIIVVHTGGTSFISAPADSHQVNN